MSEDSSLDIWVRYVWLVDSRVAVLPLSLRFLLQLRHSGLLHHSPGHEIEADPLAGSVQDIDSRPYRIFFSDNTLPVPT